MKKDIESSTTAYISYDEKEKKPKVLNEAAAMELVNIIDGHELSLDFEVDDAFLNHYEKETGKRNPTQEEINKHIVSLVRECPDEVEESPDIKPVQMGDTVGFHQWQQEEAKKDEEN